MSDSDSDNGILLPNNYHDVDVDLVDVSFGEKEIVEPPPKKARKGKKRRGRAPSPVVDDSPSPFADSSVVFEDSPAISSIPDAIADVDEDSCAYVVPDDEVPLEDICDKVRREFEKEIGKSTKRTTRASRRAAARKENNCEPIPIDDESDSVFELSLNNQSSFSFSQDEEDFSAQPDDPNVEVSVRVVWKGCSTKKFSLRKFQKIKEIYEYYAKLEGIDEGRILFTLRDKTVSPNDTPMTLSIGVSSLEGGVMDEADVASDAAQNANSDVQADPNALKLQVQRKGVREKHTVYAYPHEKISVLISKLSEDLKIPVSSIKLVFDGDHLSPDSTPNDYELEGDECIDLIEK